MDHGLFLLTIITGNILKYQGSGFFLENIITYPLMLNYITFHLIFFLPYLLSELTFLHPLALNLFHCLLFSEVRCASLSLCLLTFECTNSLHVQLQTFIANSKIVSQ